MAISVVIIGASGAVGGHVVSTLSQNESLAKLTLLVRRPIEVPSKAKVTQQVVDLNDPRSYASLIAGHTAAICTLGVGEPSKTPREEFTRVDHDLPLAFAKACREAGVLQFSLLSSVGASATASNYYLRSKGQLEESLASLGFKRLSLFHPSMILTPNNRYGMSQALMLKTWPVVSPLLLGPLRKFRGIRVEQLGKAIALNVLKLGEGMQTLEWDDFQRLQ
jgi:uncharacterized protein YbjT (DUF2867 family)